MVHRSLFTDVADVSARLGAAGYLADEATATTVFLADRLGKPLLVEGPAGVGKTELAKAVATASHAELIRLQCYEGIDEARALYEWNYRKQLLRIQTAGIDGPATAPASTGTPCTTTSSATSSCWPGRCSRRSGGPSRPCCW